MLCLVVVISFHIIIFFFRRFKDIVRCSSSVLLPVLPNRLWWCAETLFVRRHRRCRQHQYCVCCVDVVVNFVLSAHRVHKHGNCAIWFSISLTYARSRSCHFIITAVAAAAAAAILLSLTQFFVYKFSFLQRKFKLKRLLLQWSKTNQLLTVTKNHIHLQEN